jgi:hypothetical protein
MGPGRPSSRTIAENDAKKDVVSENEETQSKKFFEEKEQEPETISVPKEQFMDLVKKVEELSKNPPTTQIPVELQYPKSSTAILDDEIEELQFEEKDRIYVMADGSKPLSLSIPAKSKKQRPLTWYNEKTRKTHSLRYATNHPSVFEDVQGNNGQTQIGSILMTDGNLYVPKENVTLQRFLAIHPDNGVIFKEYDPVKENKEATSREYDVLDAKNKITKLNDLEKEFVLRVLQQVSYDPNTRKTGSFDRILFRECEKDPKKVISVVDDKKTRSLGLIFYAIQNGVIRHENGRMYDGNNIVLEIPMNVKDPFDFMATFITKAEGHRIVEKIMSDISDRYGI